MRGRSHRDSRLALALALAAAPACLAPGDAKPLRLYRAEPPLDVHEGVPAANGAPLLLRVRRVSAAGHLRERMALRRSRHEYELREHERWTEPPVAYVERALARALFERGGLSRSESLAAPALDVELLAFEEALEPGRAAEVLFTVTLVMPGGAALLERTLAEREPLTSTDPADLARALSTALTRATDRIARDLRAALEAAPPPAAGP